MKIQSVLAAISIISLSACSSSPSDAEIKNAVIASAGTPNCRYFTMENFKKVNGLAGPDGRSYQVAVQYNWKITPVPDPERYQSELVAKHAIEDVELQQAQTKFKEYREAEKTQPQDNSKEHKDLFWKLDRAVSDAEKAVRGRSMFDQALLLKHYSDDCGFMLGFLMASEDRENLIKNGGTKEVTKTVTLVKTDNGWIPTN